MIIRKNPRSTKSMKRAHLRKIFIHLPAYREPELIPTIKDAIANAKHPDRLVFGICRQFNPEDGFDNVDEYREDSRFKIKDIPYTEAKGLPYARNEINKMIEDEEYILQLDSHHRFAEGWDNTLIKMHTQLKKKGVEKPILTGYLPSYYPGTNQENEGKVQVPWQQQFVCFYPHGTIFIRPGLLKGWEDMTEPAPSRFLSGHFCFAESSWAKEIRHDPDIFFSGEEINLTVRSYTHGYDFFHPHQVVVWHATMREERDGILVWDDQHKRGEDWWSAQVNARAKIRQLFGYEDNGYDMTGHDLGKERTLRAYEMYAGISFEKRSVMKGTLDNEYPPDNSIYECNQDWHDSLLTSFYHLLQFDKSQFKHDDYDFWVCAYDNKAGTAIWREDYNETQVRHILGKVGDWYSEEKYFLTEEIPTKWVIWAHSKSQGWAERIEGGITQ